MTLPAGFLDELRDRVPISRIVGRKVAWDARKSNAAKGDFWAPCPFHQEKSPSFHVDDRKGFYYCFGCQAKGDVLTFLREADNMGFMEAVELLAREAGMAMPARDPRAAEAADRKTRLAEVMEQAVRFFRRQLSAGAGAGARAYLTRRGLGQEALDRFEIGFAPDARAALLTHLREAGVPPELIEGAGLVATPEHGSPYDRFRNRVIFPIRDARGRCIAFGGRALAEGERAKYLNSPETELFDKGRSLYNHGPARAAVGRGAALIVAEGYMDVIALVTAGFDGAVAPLGTAITEEQLSMLWRIAPEPVVALDGDAAGLRAGLRLIDLALPRMEAGQSLRFALLPGGQDPDDLIRAGGPAAMRALIDNALPMAELLWRRETEGAQLDSPERRAALDKRLREVLRKIADPSLRSHYAAAFAERRAELFGLSGRRKGGRNRLAPAPAAPLPATRGTLLAAADDTVEDRLREALILATLITHPGLLPRFEVELEALDCLTPEHATLRDALLRHADTGAQLHDADTGAQLHDADTGAQLHDADTGAQLHDADTGAQLHDADTGVQRRHDSPAPAPQQDGGADTLRDRLAREAGPALETLFALGHVTTAPPVRRPGDTDLALACLAEELARLAARRGIRREVQEAMEDIAGQPDESLTWRLREATAARHNADRARLDDATDLGEDRAALSAWLHAFVAEEPWIKKR